MQGHMQTPAQISISSSCQVKTNAGISITFRHVELVESSDTCLVTVDINYLLAYAAFRFNTTQLKRKQQERKNRDGLMIIVLLLGAKLFSR